MPERQAVIADAGGSVLCPELANRVASTDVETSRAQSNVRRSALLDSKFNGAGGSTGCLHGMDGPDDVRATDGDDTWIRTFQVSSKAIVDLIICTIFQTPNRAAASVSKRNANHQNLNPLGITGERKIREGKVTHQHSVCFLQQTFDLLSRVLRQRHKNAANIGSKAGFLEVGVGSPNLS